MKHRTHRYPTSGTHRLVMSIHYQLFKKGQPCGKVHDYLFPGERRIDGLHRAVKLLRLWDRKGYH